jgi:hypothetical protein
MDTNNPTPPLNPSESPAQPQQPVNNQKRFLPIILGVLVLLAAVIGGAYYFGTQNDNSNQVNQNTQHSNTAPVIPSEPSPTTTQITNSDWKTYTNKTYKFILNYPPTLKISSNGDFAADLVEQNIEQKDITPTDIKVRISVNQSGRNFEKIHSAPNNSVVPEEQHASDATFIKVKNRMIGGYKAVDFTYDVPGNGTEKSYTNGTIINKGGALIEISSWDSGTTEIETIVNTLQFI